MTRADILKCVEQIWNCVMKGILAPRASKEVTGSANDISDIDIMTKIIIKLSKIMDDVNYEDLIFDNKFNEQHQNDFKKFMTELEHDELLLDESQ